MFSRLNSKYTIAPDDKITRGSPNR